MKTCTKCKAEKPESAFYKDRSTKTGLYSCCKQCWAERERQATQWVKDYKEARGCADCGQKFPYYVLDFDHVRGEKKFEMWQLASRKAMEEEIAKCDVVCANCHRERTHQRKLVPV